MAAVRWRNSVRSFAIASKIKAPEMVSSRDSTLSTVIHTLLNTLSLTKPGRSATVAPVEPVYLVTGEAIRERRLILSANIGRRQSNSQSTALWNY